MMMSEDDDAKDLVDSVLFSHRLKIYDSQVMNLFLLCKQDFHHPMADRATPAPKKLMKNE